MTIAQDYQLRTRVVQEFSHTGIVGPESSPTTMTQKLRVVVQNVGSGNTIVVQGRLIGQSSWQTLATIVGATSGTTVDIAVIDEIRFNCTVYSASGGMPELVASTFFSVGAAGTVDLVDVLVDNLGSTQSTTKGLFLENTTAAANGLQQISPAVYWSGQGWKTTAPAGSMNVKARAYLVPEQGGSTPGLNWKLQSSVNGSGYTDLISISSTGGFVVGNSASIGMNLAVGANLAVNGDLTLYGVFAFNSRLKSFTSNFIYNEDASTLAIGTSDPETRDAAIYGKSVFSRNVGSQPVSIMATLVPATAIDNVTSASATQINGTIGRPQSPTISKNLSGTFYPGNLGDHYEMQVWLQDGAGKYGVAPSEIASFYDDGLGPFSIDFSWANPNFGPATYFLLAFRVNGGAWRYKNVFGVLFYNDNDGIYPDSAPASFYPDYVADGTTRNYKAYGRYQTNGANYFSPSSFDYSMTDDASGDAYDVLHSISLPTSAIAVRVLGAADGTSYSGSFDDSMGSTIETSIIWTGPTTVTPTSYGYLSDGSALTRSYDYYTTQVFYGVTVYSASFQTSATTDPNDGLYYYIRIDLSPSTDYKVLRAGGGAHVGTGTLAFDDGFVDWSANNTVTPQEFIAPAGKFAKECASFADVPIVIIKSLSVSTPTPMVQFQDSDGANLGKFGVDSSGNLTFVGKNGTVTPLAGP